MATQAETTLYWSWIDASRSGIGARNYGLRDKRWRKFLNDFAGRQRRYPDGIIINITWATVENMVPVLFSRPPTASVLPRRPGDYKAARARQLKLNYDIKQVNLFGETVRVLYDTLIFGNGIWKIGATRDAKSIFPASRPRDPEAPASVAVQMGGERVHAGEDESLYRSYDTWVQRVDPKRVFLAPGCSRLEDSPYLIHEVILPLAEVKRRPDYQNTQKLQAESIETLGLAEGYEDRSWDDREYVRLFEVWDQVRGRIVTLTESDRRKTLRDQPWPFQFLSGYPFVSLVLHPIPGEFHGYSIVDLISDHQEELNLLRGFMLQHMKRAGKGLFVDEQMMSKEEAKQLGRAGPWFVKTVRNWRTDGFYEYPASGSFDPNIYNVNTMLMEGVRLITGFSDFMFGATTKTKSATEASLQGEAVSNRVLYKRTILEQALQRVLRAMDQIGREITTGEKWLWITGPDGLTPQLFRPEDVRAEVDVDIIAGSTVDAPQDPVRSKQLLELTNIVMNPVVLQTVPVNLGELLQEACRAIGFSDPERFFPTLAEPRPPEEENQLLAAGVRVKRHERDDDMMHLEIHQTALVPPENQAILREHLLEHQKALEALQAASQEQQMMGGGMPAEAEGGGPPSLRGGPIAPRLPERGTEGTPEVGGEEMMDLAEMLRQGQQTLS